MEQVAREYQGKLKVVGANVGNAGETAAGLGIFSIPALIFFKGGKEVHRIVGAVSRQKLLDEIKKRLGI